MALQKEEMVNVIIYNKSFKYPLGTNLFEISQSFSDEFTSPIVLAKVDNELVDLFYEIEKDIRLEFVDLATNEGIRAYQNSLAFLLVRATKELFPLAKVEIEHSLSKGLYCEILKDKPINRNELKEIEAKMHEIVKQDELFVRTVMPKEKAIELFTELGMEDKVEVLSYRPKPLIHIYRFGDFYDYFYGYMVPSTGFLQTFDLKFYPPGIILRMPEKENIFKLPEFIEHPKLAKIFTESHENGEIIGVDSVAALNKMIMDGRGKEIVQIAEALQEKKIAQIADLISHEKERLRIILIAGPSSSGKTSFAQRLKIQLRVNGLKPITISMDDYFINRELTPKDEKGEYDFESIYAIDLALFNDHLMRILEGETVEIPTFNFQKGQGEYKGNVLQAGPEQPIIIEGIHGLNDVLTSEIPKKNKFKIYVSALTQLCIDKHNRIPTTDTRLLRRIIRDNQFRSHNAQQTIKRWPSVRRGEERNIFPYQEQADVMFNSALVYELAVLKKYAEPLLNQVDIDATEYSEAKRLIKFLSYFVELDDSVIPLNSILKEFIGGSSIVE